MHSCIDTDIHKFMHEYAHTCMYACICMHAGCMYARAHVRMDLEPDIGVDSVLPYIWPRRVVEVVSVQPPIDRWRLRHLAT